MQAAKWGYAEVVRLLIEKGADLDMKNKDGGTALALAEGKYRTEIVQMLKSAIELREMEAEKRTRSEYCIAKHLEFLRKNRTDLDLVIDSDDLGKVRAFFDRAFWSNRKLEPEWSHVKLALLTENKPVLRFLVHWGAPCTAENLENLREITLEKYPHYVTLLRQGGLRLPPTPKTVQTDEMRYIYYSATAEALGGSSIGLIEEGNGAAVRQVIYTNNSPSPAAKEDYNKDKVLVWSGKASDFHYIGWHCRGTGPQPASAAKRAGPGPPS
jgi:hypothetical protein